MKVKVGDEIYDSENIPVMLILSDEDKHNISHMAAEAYKYCSYPDTDEWTGDDYTKITEWMRSIS